MKNIILIDDLANNGWKSVLKKAVVKDTGDIKALSTYDLAIQEIKTKVDLIFLDVRLTEEDHNKDNISEMSGYQILKKIRNNFVSPNFSTPIILLTASNKIWIVEEFKQYGVDAFYIKEHPDYSFSKKYSRENLERLQTNYSELIKKGEKREKVWNMSKSIIDKLENHKYFNDNLICKNVKTRIIDKLKLSYAYLFNSQTEIEKNTLKADNESLAFIIYWSILEEIVKGFSDINNWNGYNKDSFSGIWKFQNNKKFINKDGDTIIVYPFKENGKYVEKKILRGEKNYKNYEEGFVNLSEQVYALLFLYGIEGKDKFTKLNTFRNEVDYIHSTVNVIFNNPLINNDNQQKTYENINKMLKLISEILNYPK